MHVPSTTLAVFVVLLAGPWTSSFAQGCVDYENYIHYLAWGATEGSGMDVAVADHDSGNWGALAAGTADLQFLLLSDAVDFGSVDGVTLPGSALDLRFHAGSIFIAAGEGGLQIVTVINVYSGNPLVSVSGLTLPGYALGVWVADETAYVACGFGGVCVVDVSDIEHPLLVDQINVSGYAEDICVHEGIAYVAIGLDGVAAFALADPDAVTAADTPGYATEVQVQGDRLYVADGLNGLQVLALPSLAPVYNVPVSVPGTVFPVLGLKVAGDRATLACEEAGLVIVDISSPTVGEIIGWIDTPGQAKGLALWGNGVIIADGDGGVFIADAMNSPPVPVTGAYQLAGAGYDVVSDGEHLYVAGDFESVLILDAATQTLITWITLFEVNYSLALVGNLLYIGGQDAFWVYDVANPAAPVLRDSLPLTSHPLGIAIDGNMAYLACDWGGLVVVDVSNPADISVDEVVYPTYFWSSLTDVAVDDAQIYLTQAAGPLMILDKASRDDLGVYWTSGAAAVAVMDDVAYLAEYDNGLDLVNVADPTAPQDLWSSDVPGGNGAPGSARDVAVAADGDCRFVYLAYSWNGYGDVIVWPSSPMLDDPLPYGSVDAPDEVRAITVQGDDLFMVSDDGQVRRAPAQCICTSVAEIPAVGGRLASFPNPFNPTTSFTFEQPMPGRASLRIYDISGRLLRTLIDGNLAAGPHTVSWNGRDDAGRVLPTGIYLARFASWGHTEVRKLTLLK